MTEGLCLVKIGFVYKMNLLPAVSANGTNCAFTWKISGTAGITRRSLNVANPAVKCTVIPSSLIMKYNR
jgi:hypothetical protein